jgi:hypothetical protein
MRPRLHVNNKGMRSTDDEAAEEEEADDGIFAVVPTMQHSIVTSIPQNFSGINDYYDMTHQEEHYYKT